MHLPSSLDLYQMFTFHQHCGVQFLGWVSGYLADIQSRVLVAMDCENRIAHWEIQLQCFGIRQDCSSYNYFLKIWGANWANQCSAVNFLSRRLISPLERRIGEILYLQSIPGRWHHSSPVSSCWGSWSWRISWGPRCRWCCPLSAHQDWWWRCDEAKISDNHYN